MNKMTRTTTLLVLACIHIHGLTFAANKQEVNIETNTDDPYVTKMYAKEIADGDNAELPLEKAHHKHHKGNKKHFHGVLHNGYHGGFHGGYHGGLHHHVPIGLPINDGLGIPYGHGLPHYDLNHVGHIPHHHHIRIGHVPESPIIHLQNHHHGMHHAHFPEYMPLPYTLPMCVIGMSLFILTYIFAVVSCVLNFYSLFKLQF